MRKEIFHTCRCTGQQFTSDEWYDYCHHHSSSEIVFTFKGYGFNINDCCMNARNVVDWKNKFCRINITVAQSPCGRWSYGHDFMAYTGGSSALARFVREDEGYERENQAICAALDSAEKFINSEIKNHSYSMNGEDDDDDENDAQKAFSAQPYLKAGLEEITKLRKLHDTRQLSIFDFL